MIQPPLLEIYAEPGDTVECFVPGKPIPQGSKRLGLIRRRGKPPIPVILDDNDKDLEVWRNAVAVISRHAMAGRAVYEDAVTVTLEFILVRVKSTPKSRTPAAVKKPDIDKLSRAVLDAITGVVVRDDSQVVQLVATKRIAELGEKPGAHIWVEMTGI